MVMSYAVVITIKGYVLNFKLRFSCAGRVKLGGTPCDIFEPVFLVTRDVKFEEKGKRTLSGAY